ncbi:unnamed protein product [Candidula unifasciata]|uniref:receptor protein-tyrosine kinase n=1 Tax=Candidula unifasciata TaxID=100452 RepID=A0A8S3YU55_9EUPU|nr:unnamed protein product [Candidula unifasciata]
MGFVTVWQSLLFLEVFTICVANSPPSLSGKVVPRVIAKLGKNTRLLCPAQSDHELTQWKKDGQSINPGLDRFKISREGHLRIQDTEMSDAGLYTCIATNGFGSININYTVIVLDEENQLFQEAGKQFKQLPNEDLNKEGSVPYFEELEKMRESVNLVKPTGSTIRLSCQASGNPAPEVYWLKNSVPYAQKRPHSTLRLHEIREDDSGDYTCIASNRLGEVNFTYHIQVIDEIRHKPRLIAPHPLNQTVDVGATVSFHCFIESVVKPQVQWLKRVDKPEDIPSPNITLVEYRDEKFMVLKNAGILLPRPDGTYLSKLVIQTVQPRDSGMFVCFATNRKGFTTRHAFLETRQGSHHGATKVGDGSSSFNTKSSDSEDSSDSELNLPLWIGIPSCIFLVIVLLVVFIMQRNNSCQRSTTANKVPRPPVPAQERDAYYYSNYQQQHTINPLLATREKLPKTPTPSVDMTSSEFSSVSRTHPNPYFYHPNHVICGQ